MRVTYASPLIVAWMFGLAGCAVYSSPPPQTTRVVVQPGPTTIVSSAPTSPPPAISELVPPPPSSSTPTVWQPGHWRYSGIDSNPWSWESGRYVAVPQGATAWVPGQWQQQSSGWVWREGHWA